MNERSAHGAATAATVNDAAAAKEEPADGPASPDSGPLPGAPPEFVPVKSAAKAAGSAAGPTDSAAAPAGPRPGSGATAKRAASGPGRSTAGPQRPAIAGGQAKADPMARYLDLLGVAPGATLDEIHTAYFTLLKHFPENLTEADEARVRELRRAYDLVRRRYVPPKSKGFKVVFDRRVTVPLMLVALLALGGTFLWMNWNSVKLQVTHHEPGVVLRLNNGSAPYGTITGYEAMHRFPTGVPSPAYSMKLAGKDETVWVSERLVVIGMTPVGN